MDKKKKVKTSIDEDVLNDLYQIKDRTETYSDVIKKLIKDYKSKK